MQVRVNAPSAALLYTTLAGNGKIRSTPGNRALCSSVINWLQNEAEYPEHWYTTLEAAAPDAASRRALCSKLADQYGKQKYGSLWLILGWALLRIIITLIIEHYFFKE